mmetsp:Transcript_9997/g.13063  ORF Transcript_9997/g.13063 Transcript_9997/m.13063 type:complete len:99 (-) Transcript_9997:191-487(-)
MNPFNFEQIEGTPGWYYSRWPGFPCMDAYIIMADYSHPKLREPYKEAEQHSTKRRKVANVSTDNEPTEHQIVPEIRDAGHGYQQQSGTCVEERGESTS